MNEQVCCQKEATTNLESHLKHNHHNQPVNLFLWTTGLPVWLGGSCGGQSPRTAVLLRPRIPCTHYFFDLFIYLGCIFNIPIQCLNILTYKMFFVF